MSRKSKKTIEAAIEAPAAELELSPIEAHDELVEAIDETLEAEADEAEVEVVTRSVVPRKWRNVYNHNPLKGTCNDQLAHDLKAALETTSLIALGEMNAIDVVGRWGNRNPGMQRMNLGNVLRNRIKRGEAVNLG